MEKVEKLGMARLQVNVDRDLFSKFKASCIFHEYTMSDMILEFMEDFVREGQEKWLDKLYAEKLTNAHEKAKN